MNYKLFRNAHIIGTEGENEKDLDAFGHFVVFNCCIYRQTTVVVLKFAI